MFRQVHWAVLQTGSASGQQFTWTAIKALSAVIMMTHAAKTALRKSWSIIGTPLKHYWHPRQLFRPLCQTPVSNPYIVWILQMKDIIWTRRLGNMRIKFRPPLIRIFGIKVYQIRNKLCMNKKIASNADQRSKKCSIRLIISAIIKKASQDEQLNQTKLTTNISYIQNVVSIF